MQTTSRELIQTGTPSGVGELLHRITDDVRTIASDEVELARVELSTNMRNAVIEAAVIVIGATVALFGFGLLCTAAVAALEPFIPSLALRLLLMAVIYLAIGGAIAMGFARKLKRDAKKAVELPVYEAKQTVQDVKDALTD